MGWRGVITLLGGGHAPFRDSLASAFDPGSPAGPCHEDRDNGHASMTVVTAVPKRPGEVKATAVEADLPQSDFSFIEP